MITRLCTDTNHCAEILRRGGLVAVPTETVYGLAADGLQPQAVERIYAVKGRPAQKPLSLLVSGVEMAAQLVQSIPAGARALMEQFWPGPLTIILEAAPTVPAIVRAGGTSVGLRCPDHPLTLALLQTANCPLAAPSANPSGAESPVDAQQVLAYLDGQVEAVLDGGPCRIGQASTVFDMSQTPYRVLRQGQISRKDIARVLAGQLQVLGLTGGTGCGKTTALQVFAEEGAYILDCDVLYHELTATCADMRNELIERFGEDIYEGHTLLRKKLGAIVFQDPQALLDLNAITHKYIRDAVQARLEDYAMAGGQVACIDAVALLESGLGEQTRYNFAVTAPESARVQRIMEREGLDEAYVLARVRAQKSCAQYAAACDGTLHNDGDLDSFRALCRRRYREVLGLDTAEHNK